MEVPINYLAVLGGVVIMMALGFLWYGPVFGKVWIKEMGWSAEAAEAKMKKSMAKNYALMALGSLVMTYVLAHSLVFASSYLNAAGVSAGLMAGFWNWLGFVAPVHLGGVLWDGKSWTLFALNAGYHLVSLLLVGMLLALWM